MRVQAAAVLVGAIEGTTLSDAERVFFRQVQPAGVTLFSRNVPATQADVLRLVNDLQSTRAGGSPPLIIAIDQEGGRVARLKAPFPNHGPAMALAGGRSDSLAQSELRALGGEVGLRLRALGINVNFAPVVDVLTESCNQAIGDRAFSENPQFAAYRAGAWLAGLQESGVLGCLKHFPGQGDAKVDTHLGCAMVETPLALLEERELLPFRTLLQQAPMVMISHCIYPALASKEASRSSVVIQQLLRQQLGFAGVVVSDDMNMGAIPQDEGSWQLALVEAVAAGVDMLLVCRYLERCRLAVEALEREAKRSPAFAARLTEAATRMMALRQRCF